MVEEVHMWKGMWVIFISVILLYSVVVGIFLVRLKHGYTSHYAPLLSYPSRFEDQAVLSNHANSFWIWGHIIIIYYMYIVLYIIYIILYIIYIIILC
jgi:hypothetical protein